MKRILITLLTAILIAAPCSQAKDNNGKLEDRLARLNQAGELTSTQKAQIKSILLRIQPQIDQLKAGKTSKSEKAQIKELKKIRAAQIEAVLTPAQREIFNQGKDERSADKSKAVSNKNA